MGPPTEYAEQQYSSDMNLKIRDIEDKLNLLRNRVMLIGQSHVDEREKNFSQIQEMKKQILQMKEENIRISALLQRLTEQLNNTIRKEELTILQRQFDLFRK